jgi:Fe2+-dicitrate sensor, membrane component
MNRKVEDILINDDPLESVASEPDGPVKELASGILRLLRFQRKEHMDAAEKVELWLRIEASRRSAERHLMARTLIGWAAVACLFVGLGGLIWFLQSGRRQPQALTVAAHGAQRLPLDSGAINLMMSGDRPLLLADDQAIDIGKLIDPDNGAKAKTSGSFKTLTIPYGKRSEAVFPDGSKVWLNAGSQLTFPESFDNRNRIVYLDGEGYFEIRSDPEHPFYVYTADMLITVLGTEFNVSSYRDDTFAATTVVHGKVSLKGVGEGKFEDLVLMPGLSAVWKRESGTLEVKEDNVTDHVSWTKKEMVLKSATLGELRQRLERIYNVNIVGEDNVLNGETFSGTLDLTQPLISLLNSLYDPVEYKIYQEERRVIIKRIKTIN